MPRPIETGQRYIPGLDGIRALAVTAVIAFHLGVPGAGGGMLGVGVFFTLSGYLITDLLLARWRRHGSLDLKTFWIRRARRLLPALFLMLIVVSIWVALFDAAQLSAVRRQVIAAALYVGNWSTIVQHGSYFARFSAPLPLDHLWSLAIEEQFYLLWPSLLFVGIWTARGRWRLAVLTLCLAAASAAGMALLYHTGGDPTRMYEGTDTRAAALLIGATLAVVWPSRSKRSALRPAVMSALDALGVVGLTVIVTLVVLTNSFSPFLYPWGFIVLSVATAAVIAPVISRASRLGRALGCRPLRWVGVRSYGIYLWQWPIIVLANPSQRPLTLTRGVLDVVATVLIASLSWRYLEEPIRRGGLSRLWQRVRGQTARIGSSRLGIAVSGAAVVALLPPVLSLSGALPVASAGRGLTGYGPLLTKTRALAERDPPRAPPPSKALIPRPPKPPPTKSSCRSIVYIGDSTSEGETSTDYIPNPRQRLDARLAHVGVTSTIPEISLARSIDETFEGSPNAATVAQRHLAGGYNGCWILAMGVNDAADVAAGSNMGLSARIARMMSIIGPRQPVLWIDAVTLVQSGPYAERGMEKWNQALVAACARYQNMRVFDWAAHAKPKWFIPDGIHYYSPGYVARSRLIARALARAFPDGQPASTTCVVQ